jgi:hypothetical protein
MAYFTAAFRGLNAHVVARTPIPTGVTLQRTLAHFVANYKIDPSAVPVNDDMSLFTHQSGATYVDTATQASYYFSDDFVEMADNSGISFFNSGQDGEIYTASYY